MINITGIKNMYNCPRGLAHVYRQQGKEKTQEVHTYIWVRISQLLPLLVPMFAVNLELRLQVWVVCFTEPHLAMYCNGTQDCRTLQCAPACVSPTHPTLPYNAHWYWCWVLDHYKMCYKFCSGVGEVRGHMALFGHVYS